MCGWLGCSARASNAVIFSGQSFIIVPAGNGRTAAAPLERRNICDRHLEEIGLAGTEVVV